MSEFDNEVSYPFYDTPKVVFDVGSGWLKGGFAGRSAPSIVLPCIVGRPKEAPTLMEAVTKEIYCGNEAMHKRGILELSHPVEHGIVKEWGDMEEYWRYVMEDTKDGISLDIDETAEEEDEYANRTPLDASEHAFLFTEAPLNPRANRKQTAELFFETYEAPAINFAIQAVLALIGGGDTSGYVVDIGDGVTHTVPVFEGYAFGPGVERLDFAGRDLTDHFVRVLREHGHVFDESSAEIEIARDIKEKLSFVAVDYEDTVAKFRRDDSDNITKDYELPDGEVIQIGEERFQCAEPLFRPELSGREKSFALHKVIHRSIQKCPIDLRTDLYRHVVLSGGTTLMPGFPERLQSELQRVIPNTVVAKVKAATERRWLAWLGGSQLASYASFNKMFIRQDEYEEYGLDILYRKSPMGSVGHASTFSDRPLRAVDDGPEAVDNN